MKIEYQLARPVFVRVVSQYTATRREPLRDPRTGEIIFVGSGGALVPSTRVAANALRTDWLFSYRPAPGTVFFVGYGGSLSEPDPLAFQRLRRSTIRSSSRAATWCGFRSCDARAVILEGGAKRSPTEGSLSTRGS